MPYNYVMDKSSFGKGVLFAIAAYFVWGLLPLYWKLLSAIHPVHILAYRIIFSLLLVGTILLAGKNSSWLKFYKDRRKRILLILAALAICINWGIYIYAVNTGHTIETSLGYYIVPLISISLGAIFFKEKFKPLQVVAFCFALAGVAIMTVFTGRLPLISLILAFSFALYGLLKKTITLSAMESLGVETLISAPLGLMLLFTGFGTDWGTAVSQGLKFPSLQGVSYFTELPPFTLFILLLCGFMTSFPLYLFAKGARMIPMSTLGFAQFLAPTMSFLTGYFIFGESFPPQNFIAFGFIWASVIIYIISLTGSKKQPPV